MTLLDLANQTNLLPLESFRRLLGYNPWHFWGMAHSTKVPLSNNCSTLVREYAWQSVDAIGRAEIRAAIARAEEKLTEHAQFAPAPHYVSETVSYPRYYDRRRWISAPIDADGRWQSIKLGEGYIQALGIEAHTLIGTVAVTRSDVDGDGLDDTFVTAATATTVTDTNQIAVYFNATDRFTGESVGTRWRIDPVQVSISGGNVTIKGKAWQLVKPILYEGYPNDDNNLQLDPTDSSTYATTVDIYRRYTNADGTTNETAQGLLTWETLPSGGIGLCCGSATDSSTDPGAIATAIARVGIRDAVHGVVMPGASSYDATSGTWAGISWASCHPPDRVLIRYLAGFPLTTSGEMDQRWQQIVARLAMAELTSPICSCDKANHQLAYWQTDLARTGGNNDDQYGAVSQTDLNNPFGTRRGHVQAWRWVLNNYQARGFVP
jgi:hypothetical protein